MCYCKENTLLSPFVKTNIFSFMYRKAQHHSWVTTTKGYGEHNWQNCRARRARPGASLTHPWGRLRQASRVHHHPVRSDAGRESTGALWVSSDADQWSQHACWVVPQRQGALGRLSSQDHQWLRLCYSWNCRLLHPWIWSLHLQGINLVDDILYLI